MEQEKETPLSRVFTVAECNTQAELAEILGIKQSSISDAKRRGAIPPEWLVKLLQKKGANPEWVMTGTGQKYLGHSDNAPQGMIVRPPAECTVEELVAEIIRRALK